MSRSSLSLAGAATGIKHVFCRDKHIFVLRKRLSRQADFCHDKHVFVATKVCLSRQKKEEEAETRYLWQLPPMINYSVTKHNHASTSVFNLEDEIACMQTCTLFVGGVRTLLDSESPPRLHEQHSNFANLPRREWNRDNAEAS